MSHYEIEMKFFQQQKKNHDLDFVAFTSRRVSPEFIRFNQTPTVLQNKIKFIPKKQLYNDYLNYNFFLSRLHLSIDYRVVITEIPDNYVINER